MRLLQTSWETSRGTYFYIYWQSAPIWAAFTELRGPEVEDCYLAKEQSRISSILSATPGYKSLEK